MTLTRDHNLTTGKVYSQVINAERRGDYLGKTVQVIPHITDEIKRRIQRLATDDVDVVITEVGGTVGDIEILPFLEAIRQFRLDVGRDNVCYLHVTLVPFIGPALFEQHPMVYAAIALTLLLAWFVLVDCRFATTRAIQQPESYSKPKALVYGNCSFLMKFLARLRADSSTSLAMQTTFASMCTRISTPIVLRRRLSSTNRSCRRS